MNPYDMIKQKTLAEMCVYKDKQIELLWSLLDDISTAGDMYRPEINPYFRHVEGLCSARSDVASSDGHNISIRDYREDTLEVRWRHYADGKIVFEDDFEEHDNSIPYYDDYGEYSGNIIDYDLYLSRN